MATAWLAHVVLAAVAYIPLLRTAPGMVEDDSKQYLYTDPARFMAQVVSLWNPDVSMGTVTHQYIGYLLPMGPYYASMEALGVPTWVAQRLWTGSLLFLAGAGVLFLLRTLAPAWRRPGTGSLDTATVGGIGAMVAAFAYMLSPYVLQNEARQFALLLPWVGLPWMIGLTARALRTGGWRHPALFALVVALVGSTNAVALILAGVGPVLWVGWELLSGRVRWRRAVSSSLKIAALSAAVSLWWGAGLVVEGGYGMDILRYTESIQTVARTSLASETLRGLGYWFFYGVDKLGLYLPMAGPYMTSLWLVAVSFAVPAVAFLAAFVVRWRERLPTSSSWWWWGRSCRWAPTRCQARRRSGASSRRPTRARRSGWRCAARAGPRRSWCSGPRSCSAPGSPHWPVAGRWWGRSWRWRPRDWSPSTCPRCGRGSSWRPTWHAPSRSRPTGSRRRTIWTSKPAPTRRAWPSSPASTSPPTGGGPPSNRCSPAS